MAKNKGKKKKDAKNEEKAKDDDGRKKVGVLNTEERPRFINCSKFGKLSSDDNGPRGLLEERILHIEPGPGSITFIDKELWEYAKENSDTVKALLDGRVLKESSESPRNVLDPVA